MGGIFISYRREDSAGHAGRLFDRLRERFGKDRVFMDVSGIEPGADFVEAIDSAVGSCDALIVVIGRKWLACADAAGNRRLDDPEDFIRLETAAALRRGIRVIPVLIQDAAMPTEKDLPEDLLKLARRQAIEISDGHWESDTGALIETLAKVLPGEAEPVSPENPPEPGTAHDPEKNRLVWLISSVVAVVLALGGLLSSVGSVRSTFSGFFSAQPEKKVETAVSPPARMPPPEVHPAAEKPVEPEKKPEPETVAVPKLAGLSQENARAALKKAGLVAGGISRVESREIKPGTVIEQAPPAGRRLAKGENVTFVVAVGPPDAALVTVPKLGGLTVAMARESLAREGLEAGDVQRKASDRSRPGTVIDQKPRPGQQVQRGTAVDILMAVAPAETAPAAASAPGKIAIVASGEPTYRSFWEGENKSAYSAKMARLYGSILSELAPGRIELSINPSGERDMRVLEKMLRDGKRLCESTGSSAVFAATSQETFASSDAESAYWPELRLTAIACDSGKQYVQRGGLSPGQADDFPFEKAMAEAMQKFAREYRHLLK